MEQKEFDMYELSEKTFNNLSELCGYLDTFGVGYSASIPKSSINIVYINQFSSNVYFYNAELIWDRNNKLKIGYYCMVGNFSYDTLY